MKEIKGIGFAIPSDTNDDYIALDSFSSLADTDIAIFSPDFKETEYDTHDDHTVFDSGRHEGKDLYN